MFQDQLNQKAWWFNFWGLQKCWIILRFKATDIFRFFLGMDSQMNCMVSRFDFYISCQFWICKMGLSKCQMWKTFGFLLTWGGEHGKINLKVKIHKFSYLTDKQRGREFKTAIPLYTTHDDIILGIVDIILNHHTKLDSLCEYWCCTQIELWRWSYKKELLKPLASFIRNVN